MKRLRNCHKQRNSRTGLLLRLLRFTSTSRNNENGIDNKTLRFNCTSDTTRRTLNKKTRKDIEINCYKQKLFQSTYMAVK